MKFNSETATAFARLVVVLIVSVAAAFGWALDADLAFSIVLSALGVIGMVWGLWWKNNNVTEPAQEAQLLLEELKANERAEGGKHAKND